MKISEYIKLSIDATERGELESALMHVCSAVDGTAKKAYPTMNAGERFCKLINDNIDIVELLFGGIDLKETIFPFPYKSRGTLTFAEILYHKYRCFLVHGDELENGYGVSPQIDIGVQQFSINLANNSISLPQSTIYALGLLCVLSPVNADHKIGNYQYWYSDPINKYVIDRWWGKIDCARSIMDFAGQVKVKMVF